MGREPFHVPNVEALAAKSESTGLDYAGNGGIMRPGSSSLMPRVASPRAHPRAQCWRGTWWWAGRGVSHVAEFRKQSGSVAPSMELNLMLALVTLLIVRASTLGHGLSLICAFVAANFFGSDSIAADRRNGFRGSSLLSCVVRSVGGEQQK
jgi:hypothetical protein